MKPKVLESVLVPLCCVLFLFFKHNLDFFAPINIVVFLFLVSAGSVFHYYVWKAVEAHVFGANPQ
ncbi:hypothetical protein [Robertkochia sediminum]|uniref:hypothetical protein n=1 Tax=Robertkochia sediminum TaxID=2785326 RepID=UPI001931B769|nr:hypothetical protein [Robertkochia sediminum]MBL7473643.1 hypothetical protein [Robertkochia sediminum]